MADIFEGLTDEPLDRLGRIADAAIATIKNHPEYEEGDLVMVMFDNDEQGSGGVALYGYDEAVEAVPNLLGHAKAMLMTAGASLRVLAPFMQNDPDRS